MALNRTVGHEELLLSCTDITVPSQVDLFILLILLFTFIPGCNNVMVSTWNKGYFSRDIFGLVSQSPSTTLHGILCEKGKISLLTLHGESRGSY